MSDAISTPISTPVSTPISLGPDQPKLRLLGQRCWITGGSRGLGLAMAQEFARAGAKVAFTFSKNTQDASDAKASLEALGAQVLMFQGSVADSAHVQRTAQAIVQAWGGIDVLVNNAGVTQILPLALLEEADWDNVMDVCAKGSFLCSRAALKYMIRARRGHILNIGSFGSEHIIDTPVHYAAAKSALRGLTEALAKEVGRYGIHVNLLGPGLLDGGFSSALPQHRINEYLDQSALQRLGSLQEIARLACFLVSDDNSFMTGTKVIADGGL